MHQLSTADERRAALDGQRINFSSRDELLSSMRQDLEAGHGFCVLNIGLEQMVRRHNDPAFRELCSGATYVTAGSASIAWLARRHCPGLERMTGADLAAAVTELAVARGERLFLLGASDEVLGRAGSMLAASHPGLAICGSEAPTAGLDWSTDEADRVADRIAASGAKLCLISLATPDQEILAARVRSRHPHLGVVCVGSGLAQLAAY